LGGDLSEREARIPQDAVPTRGIRATVGAGGDELERSEDRRMRTYEAAVKKALGEQRNGKWR
jgi:hypothetical protein